MVAFLSSDQTPQFSGTDQPTPKYEGTTSNEKKDSSENTIKVYNGTIWYDVAGPKELLDHQHYAGEGLVRHVDYGQYVDELNYIVSMDGGTASTSYASAPNNDIIDGGAA
jgi:hypothetical protein